MAQDRGAGIRTQETTKELYVDIFRINIFPMSVLPLDYTPKLLFFSNNLYYYILFYIICQF